jgi:ABC-2 type transport system ATP-binding protein
VLLSSHLLGEVQQLCDRVGVISGGRLLAESTVDDLLGQAGLLVRAEPPELARACLERLVGAGNLVEAGGGFRLRTGPERAGQVSRALADAGVTLTELRPLERTLEEVFLEMTGTDETERTRP